MKDSKPLLIIAVVSLLSGCAATGGNDYARVYDRKSNETRLVQKTDAGTFVGTSATAKAVRPAGQHP